MTKRKFSSSFPGERHKRTVQTKKRRPSPHVEHQQPPKKVVQGSPQELPIPDMPKNHPVSLENNEEKILYHFPLPPHSITSASYASQHLPYSLRSSKRFSSSTRYIEADDGEKNEAGAINDEQASYQVTRSEEFKHTLFSASPILPMSAATLVSNVAIRQHVTHIETTNPRKTKDKRHTEIRQQQYLQQPPFPFTIRPSEQTQVPTVTTARPLPAGISSDELKAYYDYDTKVFYNRTQETNPRISKVAIVSIVIWLLAVLLSSLGTSLPTIIWETRNPSVLEKVEERPYIAEIPIIGDMGAVVDMHGYLNSAGKIFTEGRVSFVSYNASGAPSSASQHKMGIYPVLFAGRLMDSVEENIKRLKQDTFDNILLVIIRPKSDEVKKLVFPYEFSGYHCGSEKRGVHVELMLRLPPGYDNNNHLLPFACQEGITCAQYNIQQLEKFFGHLENFFTKC